MTEEDKLNAIKKKLNVIIVEMLEVEENQITPDANFRTDLNADSLDLMELIMEIEDKFEQEISDEDAQTITTVGEAYAYIHQQLTETN